MKATFEYTPWNSPITEVSGLVIAGTSERDLIPMGTGVFCAPFVAITARHVIDEVFRKFEGCDPHRATGKLSFGAQFAHRFGQRLINWDIMGYGYSPSIDIAALVLEPAEDMLPHFVWQLPRFQAVPPKVGEIVTGFGYPRSTHRVAENGEAKIGLRPHTTEGAVVEVHLRRRDTAVLPFPCLHTNAQFDSGMSGGPIFNSEGHICGLISSSMPPSALGEDHSSYASLIWPMLGLTLSVDPVPPRKPKDEYVLKELVRSGMMNVLNASRIYVSNHAGRVELSFR